MILRDSFDDRSRFEGDRALRWRSIPANARIISAKVTVTPLDAHLGRAFGEVLSFDGGASDFGATRTVAAASAKKMAWVEVDFHTRRTLASAAGTFNQTTLQVDVGGGTYVEINKVGAFKTPSDVPPNDLFHLDGASSPLPGLTVAKLKLTNIDDAGVTTPVLNSVTITSVPANVSLRLGDLPPFWTHVGEMTKPETTPDFAAVLEAVLTSAKVENGFYDLPVVIHSDTIARLQVDLEVEFLAEQNPLPAGLQEVVLPFDFSTLPQSSAATLNVTVPPNTRVVAGQTTARVKGAFLETRIAYGPTGNVTPVAAAEVSPVCSQAQIISLDEDDEDVAATAVDLLIEATTPAVRLRLDVRGDLDGKPDDGSLLPGPVELSLDQQAVKGPRWTSVPLPAEFVFSKSQSEKAGGRKQRYWLVLQSLVGAAAWSASKAAPSALNMQCTRDGGQSWRDTIAMPGTRSDQTVPGEGPFAAFFRLRGQPKTFKVPIELQVGTDEHMVRVKLDRFQPLGRVDFTLDTELAQGLNEYLAKAAPATCPETEHLINPEFEQWLRVGDKLISQPAIDIDSPIRAVAFAPNGALAYVLDQSKKKDLLVVVDVDCGQVKEKISLTIDNPKAFVVSPDGARAYITNGKRIQVVNLTANQVLAEVFDLQLNPTGSEAVVNDLAVSPDGARLYVASLNSSTSQNGIRVIDTAKLEQQLTSGLSVAGLLNLKNVPAVSAQQGSPIAIAVSPDGSLLYMVILQMPSTNGVVQIIDTTTFAAPGPDIAAGSLPKAIALTPDGERAIVVNGGAGNVSVIETATRTSATISVGPSPVDVGVSPDGTRAYVLESDNSISVIDLGRQVVTENFKFVPGSITPAPAAVALALSLQGDQIYVAHNGHNSFVSPIQFGTRRPAEWQITSGMVRPFCLPPSFHLVAVLGSDPKPSAMSQVVPVAESCLYEFSFQGIAIESDSNEPPAMAEVLWLGRDCGLLRADQVPIKLREVAPVDTPPPRAVLFAAGAADRTASLELHRVRLTAPAGADQAEVRFTVPSNAAGAIDQVSLIATSEVATNADFKLQEDGRLAGWTLSPGVAPGFAVLAADDGTQLRNAGAVTAELVQTVEAKSGAPFTLEFEGKAVAGSTLQKSQRVELRWLNAAGASTGSPTVIEILPDGLASSVGSGTAPADATQAEIHLIVPAGTTQVVKRVSLRFSTPTIVPVTFIAEAPGELTVSGVRVAFEQVEATAPAVPDRGLCIPTPPGRGPGETSGDSCFCHHCESEQPIVEQKAVVTSAGRPSLTGKCATCGTKLLRQGGPRVVGAEPFSLRTTSTTTQPAVIHPLISRRERSAGNAEAIAAIPLTAIRGIGQARAKQLAEIGIDSVEKLAASTPEIVARIKFITLEMATQLVVQAKTASHNPD